jgi:hypothetical protein
LESPEFFLRPIAVDPLVVSAVDAELQAIHQRLNKPKKLTTAAAYLEYLLDTENSVKARINNIKTILG